MDMIATIFDIAIPFQGWRDRARSGTRHPTTPCPGDLRRPLTCTTSAVLRMRQVAGTEVWAGGLGLCARGDALLAHGQRFRLSIQLGVGGGMLLEKAPKGGFAGEPVHRQVAARFAEAAKELGSEEALRARKQPGPGAVAGVHALELGFPALDDLVLPDAREHAVSLPHAQRLVKRWSPGAVLSQRVVLRGQHAGHQVDELA